MRVNAIQGMDGAGAQSNAQAVGAGEDFSSYLPTTASLDQIFEEASRTYNVPKNLIKAIAKAESDFNPNATSGAGAQGIMQLMPATARELGVTDAYDPYQNIMGGTKYISQMLAKYDGNITLALAAYNAVLYGPANSVPGIGSNLVGIVEVQLLVGSRRTAGVPPEHNGQLLPGDVVVGPKTPVGIPAHDAL